MEIMCVPDDAVTICHLPDYESCSISFGESSYSFGQCEHFVFLLVVMYLELWSGVCDEGKFIICKQRGS